MQEAAWKNTKYSRNETILKIGHLPKAIDFAKWLVWVKNWNGQNRAKNDSTSTFELFCAKNRCKKHQILEKWDHFENRTSSKGYRVWKMVSLGEKFKWPKTCEKRFYKHLKVVLCKKPLGKTPNIREIRPFWKSVILQSLSTLKNEQFESKNSKRQKRAKNDSASPLELFCAKDRWKKTPNIWEMRPFWKSAILQRL